MKKQIATLLSLCFIASCQPVLSQPVSADHFPLLASKLNEDRSAAVDRLMAPWSAQTPGAAILVLKGGKVLHSKGYGLADLKAGRAIEQETAFDLASVSKAFTAMAVMILAERGKLRYDDPLSKFFPEFPAYAQRITVRHLLQHTAGLPDYMQLYIKRCGDKCPEPTSREVLKLLAKQPEPVFTPGEKWEYSNSGYLVLAQIVEKASGKRFPQFCREAIFAPLGMTQTLIADETKPKVPQRAISYGKVDGRYQNIDYTFLNYVYGDGNVNTNLNEMRLWAQAIKSDKLVSRATREQAFASGKLNNGEPTKYGFGWLVGESSHGPWIGHGGSWVGFRTAIAHMLRQDLTVVVLANAADFDATTMSNDIVKLYLKGD